MRTDSMNVRSIGKRAAVLLLSAAVSVTAVWMPQIGSSASAATTFRDVSGHWASAYVQKAVEKQIVSGYSDGTFRPEQPVTRAEFTKMLNVALGNTGTADSIFSDVPTSEWFYNDVCKAVAAGYISGYDDGTFGPARTITRQEAAVMLSRIVPTYGYAANLGAYDDGAEVAAWAQDAVKRIVGKEYLGTYGDNQIHPGDTLNRAQAVKIVVSITEKERIISNNQTVVQSGVTLNDMIFTNRISIGSGVGDGVVNINNCMILGTLNIEGGGSAGSNGVILGDSRVANCRVHRQNELVRIQAQGDTTLLETSVEQIARLETYNTTGRGFQNVSLLRAAELTTDCGIGVLNVEGTKCDVDLLAGLVEHLVIYADATKLDINMAAVSSVAVADVYARGASFRGAGKIDTLNVFADGVTYETEPGQISIASAVKVPPMAA